MSTELAADREPRPGFERLPAWLLFGVLVLSEYLLVSYCFDARELLAPTNLEAALGGVGSVALLGFVIVATTVITGGRAPQQALERLSLLRPSRAASAGFASLHAVVYVGMLLVARHVATASGLSLVTARSLLALAVFLGGVSLGLAALALWERRALVEALRLVRGALFIGVAVGALAWGAGVAAQFVWEPLARYTLELVHALLTLIASDPVASVEEQLVGTSRFYVHIAPVCSGVEGIGLMLAFMTAFLYIERRELRWPSALVLLPVTTALIWLLNVVRITALIAVGTWASPQVALGGFHSKAGWVLFTLAALGAVLIVRQSTLFRRSLPSAAGGGGVPSQAPIDGPSDGMSNGALSTPGAGGAEAAYLVPLLSVLAVSLVAGLATTDFDYLYPLRVVVAVGVLYQFRAHYSRFRLDSPWLGLAVGAALGAVWIAAFQRPEVATEPSTGQTLAAMSPGWAALWIAFRVVGAVLTVPIVEELAFRGYLMRRFSARAFELVPFGRSTWLGLVVSSVAFGALHSQWLLGLVAGAVFGLLAKLRGRLSDAVIAHAAANLALVIYVLATGEWALLG